MATQANILAWKIPWTEEPDSLQYGGHKESDVTEHAHIHSCLYELKSLDYPLPQTQIWNAITLMNQYDFKNNT